MQRLFKSKTENEERLKVIIESDTNLKNRQKAMKELRNVVGGSFFALVSHEVYASIPGKPLYFRRFVRATLMYEDTLLNR